LKGYALKIVLFVHIKFLGVDLDPRNTVYPCWHIIVSNFGIHDKY